MLITCDDTAASGNTGSRYGEAPLTTEGLASRKQKCSRHGRAVAQRKMLAAIALASIDQLTASHRRQR